MKFLRDNKYDRESKKKRFGYTKNLTIFNIHIPTRLFTKRQRSILRNENHFVQENLKFYTYHF